MEQSERVISFIETFCTLNGSFLNEPFKVLPFQREIIEKVYQTDEEGKRKIRTALIGLPRKNAKSTLIAACCVYGLIADTADKAPVVVVAAGDREQGRIIHSEIKRMIEASPELSAICEIQRNQISCSRNGGVALVVSADAGRLGQGLNPTLIAIDEYHIHKNTELFDALTLGSAARNEPLTLVISTAGYEEDTPLGQLYRYGRKVESGEVDDDSFAFVWWGPTDNEEYDANDEETWKRFNPAWDYFINHEEFRSAHSRTPVAPFTRFRLNGWTATSNHWLPDGAFAALGSDRKLNPGERVVLGFDGAWQSDSTALVAVTVDEPRHLEIIGCWEKPEDQHSIGWRTPIHEVKQCIFDAFEKFNVVELAADPWRFEQTLQELAEEGLPIVEFPTGSVQRMQQATLALYDAIIDGAISHDNDPQLIRHFANAHLKEDARGARITKDRRGSTKKIDLAVASLIAYQRAVSWRDFQAPESQILVV
jgi:phage terminase large subunit-like protein